MNRARTFDLCCFFANKIRGMPISHPVVVNRVGTHWYTHTNRPQSDITEDVSRKSLNVSLY